MESITKPVIGIVFCGFSDDRLFVPFSYIQAIEKSDGIPVIIPYLSDAVMISHRNFLVKNCRLITALPTEKPISFILR